MWQLRCHWGLGRPARLGRAGLRLLQASCPLPLLPQRALLPRLPPPSSPCSLSRSGCSSFHLASLSLESTPLLLAAPVHHSASPIPSIPGSLPASLPLTRVLTLLPTSPRPSAGRLSAASALCFPPLWTPGCAGQTQVLVFPGICRPVASREGAAGWLGQEGGALLGSPRSSLWPLQAGRVQGGQTLV